MKCLVVVFITLGLAMSFPQRCEAARDPQDRDSVELTHGKSISLL